MPCTEEKKKETNLFYFSQSLFLNQNVKFTRNAFSKRFESEEMQKAIERKWISAVSSGATANFWHLDPACIVNHQLTNIVDPLFSAWLILMNPRIIEIPTISRNWQRINFRISGLRLGNVFFLFFQKIWMKTKSKTVSSRFLCILSKKIIKKKKNLFAKFGEKLGKSYSRYCVLPFNSPIQFLGKWRFKESFRYSSYDINR